MNEKLKTRMFEETRLLLDLIAEIYDSIEYVTLKVFKETGFDF